MNDSIHFITNTIGLETNQKERKSISRLFRSLNNLVLYRSSINDLC